MSDLPDFATALKLAHKSNAPVRYMDDAGNILTIRPDQVQEFEAKLAEKRDPGGKRARGLSLGCVVGILILLALLAAAIVRGA